MLFSNQARRGLTKFGQLNRASQLTNALMKNNAQKRPFSNKIGENDKLESAEKQAKKDILQKDDYKQFSREPIMKNFGDLERGEIPEALKYERPMEFTTTQNGIRVCTEKMNGSQVAAVGVFIGAGTRQETLESSGAAHFLEHLHFKGTTNRTRRQLEMEVENTGTQLNAYTSREHTLYHTLSFPEGVSKSVEILGDMLCNSIYDNWHLENEKDTIWQELEATN